MISKKATYGLTAALLLAKQHGANPVLITDLASKGRIPKKFLEAILLELRKAGILDSKKGKGGGYYLGRNPGTITVGEILRTLDGPLYATPFKTLNQEDVEIEKIMKEVRDAMSNILDKTTLRDVIDRSQKGQNVLNYVI